MYAAEAKANWRNGKMNRAEKHIEKFKNRPLMKIPLQDYGK